MSSKVAVELAVKKGYTIDKAGIIYNPKGKILTGSIFSNGYKKVGFRMDKYSSYPLFFHKFQAYKKYGVNIFKVGVEVRHLNGKKLDNSWDNILIGTRSDNVMDIPKNKRVIIARKLSSFRRVFTNEQVINIILDRKKGLNYIQLCEKYKTSKSTLSYLFNKAQYVDR